MKIYVDMDMVLVNFKKGVLSIPGISISDFDVNEKLSPKIKGKILLTKNFWENLPEMDDIHLLYEYLQPYDFYILTAKGTFDNRSCEGKWKWIQNHFPVKKDHFFCVPREAKRLFANKDSVLIDDYDKNIKEFRDAGGIGILHHSISDTIKQLKTLKE